MGTHVICDSNFKLQILASGRNIHLMEGNDKIPITIISKRIQKDAALSVVKQFNLLFDYNFINNKSTIRIYHFTQSNILKQERFHCLRKIKIQVHR